jgi:hypothetical protein
MGRPTAIALPSRFELATPDTAALAALICVGVATAIATAFIKLHLGISGHAIVLTVAPTLLGVSLFPRRLAGSTIAASALVTGGALWMAGAGSVGPAALTAFAVTGLLTDVVLARRWSGIWLYAALVVASLLANVAAFGSHMLEAAALGFDAGGGKALAIQVASYAACGGAAGFLGAVLAFQLRTKSRV